MPKKAIQLSDHFTYSRLLRFVLPCIGTMLFTSIYGIVDGLCVSNFVGKTAFAAVNLIMPLPQLLDVYKRQDYSISRAEAVSRAEDYFAALAKPLALDADGAGDEDEQPTRDPHTLAAVSYTHLDVYKRQTGRCPASPAPPACARRGRSCATRRSTPSP